MPSEIGHFANRGLAYAKKGDISSALADCNQAIALDPTLVSAYINRADIYIKQDEHDRALADLNTVVKLNPKEADSYVSRAIIYLRHRDFAQAIEDLTVAIKLDSHSPITWRDRRFAYRKMGDNAHAKADEEQAIRLDPTMRQPTTGSGGDSASQRRNARARQGHPEKTRRCEVASCKSQHRDGAIADFTQAIALDPKQAIGYINRGVAYMVKWDWDHAIADLMGHRFARLCDRC